MGYARIILYPHAFMLEKDFKVLLTGSFLVKTAQHAEISRLTLTPAILGKTEGKMAALFLYRSIYQWLKKNAVNYIYFIVEENYFCKLKNRFGCHMLGKPYRFSRSHCKSFAVMLDFKESDQYLFNRNRFLRKWFNRLLRIT